MQTKRLYILLIIGLMFISLGSAIEQDLGTAVKGECINLVQICDTCTTNNISRVLFPNSTASNTEEIEMTKDGTYYNASFCATSTIGTYVVLGHGDLSGKDTVWTYTFEVTGGGESITVAKAIMYLGLLIVLVLLFVCSIFGISILPSGNDRDDEDFFIDINNLKYLRIVLFLVAWILLTALVFTSANIGLAFFSAGMFGNLLFDLYYIMFSLTLPIVVFLFIWIFLKIFRDNKIKKMIERGVDIEQI